MNTPEQSLRYNRQNAIVDGNLIPGPSQMAPVQSSSPGSGRRHWHFGMLFFVMPLGGIASLAHLLRGVSSNILRQEFGGLGVVVCALAYVAVFLRHVVRALVEDARQVKVSNHLEPLLATRTLPQGSPKPAPSGNPTRRYEPVEQRT